MRITFSLPVLGMSGGNKVVGIYARELVRRGHKVVLISPPPKPPTFKEVLKSFVKGTRRPPKINIPLPFFEGIGVDHRILDRWRIPTDDDVPDGDVVIATWWETAEWIHALSPRKGAKVYFIQHHEVFPYLPVERCHATYRLPLHKIVIARWLKDVMKKHYGDEVVDLVPNSVDRNQFFADVREKQPQPTVGFLYSTAPFKGLDVSLEVVRRLRQQIPRLRVISFGTEHPHPTLPLPEGTEFSFSPPQDRLRELYAQCDVWLTASRTEGFNLPAMEAMSCRTPVVSTKAGWPEEAVVTGKNGVLVDVDDRDGLERGLKEILSLSPEAWKTVSQQACETTRAGSWEESSRQFEAALFHACRRALKGEIAGMPSEAPPVQE